MTRIRHLEIRNFRSIQALDWSPSNGINCLIGPGDSGKSTILDAIDFCLGAKRQVSFSDTDFFALDTTRTIIISATIGALPDSLKNFDTYGDFLRSFNSQTKLVDDEPHTGSETVLTLRLEVGADLEPSWTLFSERAKQQQLERSLAWKDRSLLSPARIGTYANANLSWARNSVLNRLTEERTDLGLELARAARVARSTFGSQATPQLTKTLGIVTQTAANLGVAVGSKAQALLDAHSVSIGDGAIALHSETGIPLRSLGTGSSRLLVAGLQRAAAAAATMALVDEVEYGLEPHRLMRLLDSLGAKDGAEPLQVFMTTHSPVTIKELDCRQLFVVRQHSAQQTVTCAELDTTIQGCMRTSPEAFLAKSVIVCEGASEVGFVRGLDQWAVNAGATSFLANGGSYTNAGGSTPDLCFQRAETFLKLGYRVLLLIDADKPITTPNLDTRFVAGGGKYLTWRDGYTLEDALFQSCSDNAIHSLIRNVEARLGRELLEEQIKSTSQGRTTLDAIEAEGIFDGYGAESRTLLAKTAQNKKRSWFKSVGAFQEVARDIVGPYLHEADPEFRAVIEELLEWMRVVS